MSKNRPKSSLVGIGDFALSAYNTNKLRRMGQEIESFNQDMAHRIDRLAALQFDLAEHQMAKSRMNHLETLRQFHNQNTEILKISGIVESIDGRLTRIEDRENDVGDLKLSLIAVENEIKNIKLIPKEFPEFAALIAENLESVVDELALDQIKFLAVEEIKWARTVVSEVKRLKEIKFQEIMS